MKIIHVLFKTHLDLGFTDMAERVCDQYVNTFIPSALDLAAATRDRGDERFVWTTGSWLVDHFLRVATSEQCRRMEDAIAAGDIHWHALPFTTHTELMSRELFRYGLSISSELDRRFGRTTIAAKMTDVPGHTRAMIPCLADHGVAYLHIGVNAASATIRCPARFRWRHPDGEEIIVSYGAGYDAAGYDAGATDLLHFAHTGDNHGPPSMADVEREFADLKERFPDFTPVASSLDRYAQSLIARRHSLPIVEEEFSDTWIHGIGADPAKVARFRCVERCLADSRQQPEGSAISTARRHLLLVAEHTWGKDEKSHLKDYINYTQTDFNAARSADIVAAPHQDEFGATQEVFTYSAFEASWLEQRQAVDLAIEALEGDPRHTALQADLDALRPVRRSIQETAAWQEGERHRLGGFDVEFCHRTGALLACVDRSGRDWAVNGPLARYSYQTFDAEDFEDFLHRYNPSLEETSSWARPDFTKPGLERIAGVQHRQLLASAARFEQQGDSVWVEAALPSPAETCYGAPEWIQLYYHFGATTLEIELQWFDKAACRLPEASWIGFGLPDDGDWMMQKMGSPVSPLGVAEAGNRALHALDSGLIYQNTGDLRLLSLDAPLFSPGRPRILEFDTEPPRLTEGWHINLHNNLWGTNFPMWFGEPMKFRFELSGSDRSTSQGRTDES